MLVTDGAGQVLAANAELREQFGEPAHPHGPAHLDDWLPPASRIFVQTHVWPLLLRQGRVDEIYLKLRSQGGEWRPVLLNARCWPGDAPPASTRIHWVFFKAVERQRFEAELLQTRRRLENLLLSANAGTWEWHVPSGALRVNERWAAMLGWPFADTQALDLARRSAQLHPEEREAVGQQLAALLDECRPEYLSDHRMRHHDGHWVWVQERGRVVSRLSDGSPEWVFGSLVDISETIAQRDALRRSEAMLSRTSDLAGVGGWELDLRSEALYWSPQTCRIHGVPEGYRPRLEEALDFYPADARARLVAEVGRSQQDGRGWDLELPFVRRDGSLLTVRALGAVEHEDGKPARLIGAFQDVSEQHRLMASLRAAKSAAEAASEAKSMFLANMSHEIRTPMNAIIGIGQLLADTPLNQDQGQLLGKLQTAGRSLLSLIDDVLDLAKIEAGEMGIERVAFNPRELLLELDTVFAALAGSKRLHWTLQMAPELPDRVTGDVTRLRQVLSNLLSNALKFTQQGSVTLSVVRDGAQWRFTVRDTGIGIAEEAQGRLFQPFAQADASTTRRFGGTGLGLYIFRRLVDLMGGQLTLRSALGEGTEFSVLLRLENAGQASSEASPRSITSPSTAPGAAQRLAGVRLLVVDDSEINLEVLSRLLVREGAEVVCEPGAAPALARLQRHEAFAAVLMDIQMPEMDGLEATRRIRQIPGLARLPVLALTAGALADERRRALEAGMDDFLTKPIEVAKLVETLSRHLGACANTVTDTSRLAILPASAVKPGLEGLNLAAALSRLGDDLPLLHRLLARLLDTFDASWAAGLSTMDSQSLQAALHRLRGAASMLGAERVDLLATQAEAHLRQGLPQAELSPQLEALGDALSQLRQSAEPMLAQVRSQVEPTIAADMPAPEQAAARLAELLLLLRQQDIGALDAFDALLPWLRAQGLPSTELGRLQRCIASARATTSLCGESAPPSAMREERCMSKLIQSLKAKMLQSTKLLQQLASDRSRNAGRSPDTEHDYLRLGQSLLRRAKVAQDGLIGVVSDTLRPSTFQKRMSALRFTLQQRQLELLGSIIEPVSDEQAQRHIAAFDEQIARVQALLELRRRGLGGLRALRNSKRRALSGLPPDWRVQLCNRGRAGRYGAALLVAALTGCRPSELERGIKVWQTQDAATQEIEIHFEVAGAKVKREQGQPHRRLTYAAGDTHPLLSMIKALLPGTAETPVVVQVASAMNFSAEVQRLAGCLWPSHPHTVTAYCLRHQWGADAKRNGDADAVSRGLGHLSRKTQRVYGTASQGKPAHRLKPLRIEAERPVKGTAPEVAPTDPDEPESAS